LISIIIPEELEVRKWAAQKNLQISNYTDFIKSKELEDEMNKRIREVCKEKNFNGLEIPKKIHISLNEFTMENNCLTPTMKLK